MINFGVIGYGYWGPNVVRNLNSLDGVRVLSIADKSLSARNRAIKANPGTHVTDDVGELISDTNIDCIAIITPVWTHFELARAVLDSGKHVFVEKPFTSSCDQAARLIDLAATKNLVLMVDHTFLFTGAVRKIKQLVEDEALGKLYYYDSMRVNLGLFQHDINVLWDLAPHDLAIIDHIIGDGPEEIVATGQEHLNHYEDVAFMTLYFPNNVIAHVNVNWLSPVKVRTTLIGGAKKMLVWNDLEADEKIKIYDKGVKVEGAEGVYDLLVNYRSGDMWAPHLDQVEALHMELAYFVECIVRNEIPFNDGNAGLRIVKMLEAADQSLRKRGVAVQV
jgi:predicted dehydrogenase